ncbi:MAG TPA: hypothetical protein VHD69_01860 [Candidatus Paceibacterota bacterium]|nr:hypothetical protein [Candidatus Paceibacterota bacterium]
MIDNELNVTAKVRELEMALDKLALDFQDKERKVADLKEKIAADKSLIRDKEQEERRLESELRRAEMELNEAKRNHDKHHAEFERFQNDMRRAQAAGKTGGKRIAA